MKAESLDDYHQAQAVGVMNYWVYFNSSPRVEPADLVIFDDAHLAEQPLSGMFTPARDPDARGNPPLRGLVRPNSGALSGRLPHATSHA